MFVDINDISPAFFTSPRVNVTAVDYLINLSISLAVYHGVMLLQVVPCCLAIDENLIMLTSC